MKKTIIILSVFLVSFQLKAQNKQEKIVKLLSIMQSEQMIDKIFDNMLQVMKQQETQEMSQIKHEELMNFIMSEIKGITRKAINTDYPAIYDKYLTEEEIDGLIIFYQSPVGQRYLKTMPDIQNEFMQGFMTKYISDFQSKVEMKKKELSDKK